MRAVRVPVPGRQRRTRRVGRRAALLLGPLFIFLGLAGIVAAAVGATQATGHLGPDELPEPQTFFPDANVCRAASTALTTGLEDAATFPALTCPTESLATSATGAQTTDVVLAKGNMLAVPYVYTDRGFSVATDASITNGTVVGSLKAAVNAGCDDTPDYLIDDSSTMPFSFASGVGEPIVEQTTTFGPGTGILGRDESPLNRILPEPTVFPRVVRYRADVDFVTSGTDTPLPREQAAAFNFITLEPTFGNARLTATVIGGDVIAPDAQLALCFDSAFTATTMLTTAAGLTNPSTAGLYPLWTTMLSTPGLQDEQIQTFSYVTSCKRVGGTFTDVDNDCWADTSDTLSTGATAADQDEDGLLDGLEISWIGSAACPTGGASPVLTKDCDGDGRTDLEEMVGPANLLTNPRIQDTDGDGLLDAGLNLDCDKDASASGLGKPDMPLAAQTANPGNGRRRLAFAIMYCKPDGTSTNAAGTGGRPFGNVAALSQDNCPNIANASQTNSANALIDLDSFPVVGDSNGRFTSTADGLRDNTHSDGRFTGDACEMDADNDGLIDEVEAGRWEEGPACDNSFDDDSDGAVNDGCPAADPFAEGELGACDNLFDDDGDGLVNDGCRVVGNAETGGQCSDATDSDADWRVNDGCPANGEPEYGATAARFCGNPVDDENDGMLNDGCPQAGASAETSCSNLVDDDGDGVPNDGCPIAGVSSEGDTGACANALDDDGDSVFNDGCTQLGTAEQGSQCADALDNDTDTHVNDGCPAFGTAEAGPANPAFCIGNRLDDDGDGVPNDGCPKTSFAYTAAPAGSAYCNLDGVGQPIVTDKINRDTDGDGTADGVECLMAKNPASAASKPGTTLTVEQLIFFRVQNLTQPASGVKVDLDDDDELNDFWEVKLGFAAGVRDSDRDGCADSVETADVDGSRVASDSDRLAVARAVLKEGAFAAPAPPPTLEEIRTLDQDGNGVAGDPDRLAVARIVVGVAPATNLYNLNCRATTIGEDAN